MGNGQSTNGGYGILLFGTAPTDKLVADTWYHFAVTFQGSSAYPYTPSRASLYLDGNLIGSKVRKLRKVMLIELLSCGTKDLVVLLLELLEQETSLLKNLLYLNSITKILESKSLLPLLTNSDSGATKGTHSIILQSNQILELTKKSTKT
jgi:hypothetical protein